MAQSPCPHRIVDDMGYAYCMGSIGGSVWHSVKGWRNAPRGFRNRFLGASKAVAARAPVLGGNFAVWGLCFSTYDCCFLHWRRKDDPLNAIAAGAATGATLAWRAGASSMMKSAAIGGVFLAVIEGLGLMMQKAFAQPQQAGQPMSPFSTYQPAGPGRHVGELASDTDYDQTVAPNIAGVNNGNDWNMNEEDEMFDFDNFGNDNNNNEMNSYSDFDHNVEFNDNNPNSYS